MNNLQKKLWHYHFVVALKLKDNKQIQKLLSLASEQHSGVDLTLRDNKDKSVYDYALQYGRKDIAGEILDTLLQQNFQLSESDIYTPDGTVDPRKIFHLTRRPAHLLDPYFQQVGCFDDYDNYAFPVEKFNHRTKFLSGSQTTWECHCSERLSRPPTDSNTYNLRADYEKHVLEHVYLGKFAKEKEITLAVLGAGHFFDTLVLIAKLYAEGYTHLRVCLIDDIYKNKEAEFHEQFSTVLAQYKLHDVDLELYRDIDFYQVQVKAQIIPPPTLLCACDLDMEINGGKQLTLIEKTASELGAYAYVSADKVSVKSAIANNNYMQAERVEKQPAILIKPLAEPVLLVADNKLTFEQFKQELEQDYTNTFFLWRRSHMLTKIANKEIATIQDVEIEVNKQPTLYNRSRKILAANRAK